MNPCVCCGDWPDQPIGVTTHHPYWPMRRIRNIRTMALCLSGNTELLPMALTMVGGKALPAGGPAQAVTKGNQASKGHRVGCGGSLAAPNMAGTAHPRTCHTTCKRRDRRSECLLSPVKTKGPAPCDAEPWIRGPSQFVITGWGLLPGGSLTSPTYREHPYYGSWTLWNQDGYTIPRAIITPRRIASKSSAITCSAT